MRVNTIHNQSFKGIPVADVSIFSKNITKKAKLYQLTQNDKNFIEHLYWAVDVAELMPGFKDFQYGLWDEIIRHGLDSGLFKGGCSILEVQDNRPCGVLNYSKIRDFHNLNFIATWPLKKGEKAPFAGKVLIKEFLERVLKTGSEKIELEALRFGHFDCISKYLKLGFKLAGGDNYQETMVMKRENIPKSIEMLDENISFDRIDSNKEEDLFKFLDSAWISKDKKKKYKNA